MRDGKPGRKALRKLFEDNPKEFISQRAALEKSHQAGATKKRKAAMKGESPPEIEEIDDGEARCIALCERWLAENA